MIYSSEVVLSTLQTAPLGSLVLGFGYHHGGAPFLVANSVEHGGKALVRLSGLYYTFAEDHRTPLLLLPEAIVRFDQTSSIPDDKIPDDGTLMITDDGPGIYECQSRIRARGGRLTLLSGEQADFYRTRDTPAFVRWEIGFMRRQEFVSVASIEALPENKEK